MVKNKNIFFILIILILSISLFSIYFYKSKDTIYDLEKSQSTFSKSGLDNFLIDNLSTQTLDSKVNNIDLELKNYLGDSIENIDLIYYNINSGNSIEYNKDDEFMAASTYKLLLNIVAYENIKDGFVSIDEEIPYYYHHYEEGTGLLQNMYFKSIDLKTLLDYSIIYSDNIATNMIADYLGGHENIRKEGSEILNINISLEENVLTAEEMFKALKYIYDHKEESYFNHLLDIMTETIFNDRLDKYLPEEIVAHKIGSIDSYVHDVGIVLTDNPYFLIIYTNELEYADEKISDISRIIYNLNG